MQLAFLRTCRSLRRALLALAWLCAIASAEARQWVTINGQTFEAEFVRVEGQNGIFRVEDREDPYPLTRLSVADRLFIGRTVHAQGAAPAAEAALSPQTASPTPAAGGATEPAKPAAGDLQLAGQPLSSRGANVVDIPITEAAQLKEVRDAYGKSSTTAKMLLVLPDGFQPTAQSCPILLVSATADGKASSIGSAKAHYLPDATQKGYLVIAVDGEFGKPPKGDPPDSRWALAQAGLGALYNEWPKARTWPIAAAGVSGGGGYASHQAMHLLDLHYPLMGLLLSVTRSTPNDFPDVLKKAPRASIRTLPVFYSGGEKDPLTTKDAVNKARSALTAAGFKNVRFEMFPGGHHLHRPHLQAALDWFLEEHNKTGAAPTR